ncbi:MAG: hypothetical protein K0S56_1828 [Microvirga sp.]|jgi:hypothetical protein|nr:hypothetical protein [Microvirga sp.]
MNHRRLSGAITHQEVRRLKIAAHEAARRRRPLDVLITIHPGRMIDPPDDPGLFFRLVVKKLGQWFRNNRHPWWGLWVRENYHGLGREHFHLLIHLPPRLHRKLRKALRRWWPDQGVVDLREADDEALGYLLKQMTPQAMFALKFLITREKASRHDLAKVAAVLGKRVGMTSNLAKIVRELEVPLRSRPGSSSGCLQTRANEDWRDEHDTNA